MATDLVSPTPVNAARTVHFRLVGDASGATSPAASEPSTRSSTAFSIPPPPASPLPPPKLFSPDSNGSLANGSASQEAYFHDDDYYEDTDEHQPVASTSKLVHGEELRHYPPRPLASSVSSREAQFDLDSEELEEHDTSHEPLMEGLVHSGLRRASLDLRGEARRLKELELDAEEASPPDWLSRGGGIWAGIANMSNSILGAGIIGLPYALREAGFFSGIILLVILGMVTDWTIRLIVLNAKMSGRRTYIDILDSCFGKPGRAAASFFQFAFAFGGMCAFCVIIGDTLPRVFQWLVGPDANAVTNFFISRRVVTTILTVGVSYPLSLYRDIEKLSHASALALVSMVVIVISVGVRGPGVEDELKGESSERWTFLESVCCPLLSSQRLNARQDCSADRLVYQGVFEAIGVISFAFVCHHNSLLIYGSLKQPTLDRFAQVTHVSTTLSVVACLCMSISGFLVFTNKTQGNILNNFSEDDWLINLARACVRSLPSLCPLPM